MIDRPSTQPAGNDDTIARSDRNASLQELADSLRSTWRHGSSPTLSSYLEQHPELCSDSSLVIELAVDEYRLRCSHGQISSIGQYCKPFSAISRSLQSSIFRQIEVERYLDEHPSFRMVEEDTKWPVVDDTIAGYFVLEELGRGALARVFLCSQKALGGRQVVVKVSRRGSQEGHTLGKLQHANIMPIYSVEMEEDEELSCLCTPFLGRSTLYDLINVAFSDGIPTKNSAVLEAARIRRVSSDREAESPPPLIAYRNCTYVEGILVLAIKLCDALAHAHKAGIIHGDIKPSNILLTPSGEPVLLDFNLARDDDLSLDVRGGTLPYMAPEQISQLLLDEEFCTSKCDEKSEIFSFGVVLYELLSGQVPFEIDQELDVLGSIPEQLLERQFRGVPSLEDRNPQISIPLSATIDRCLDYDRESRFSSMVELQAALQEELSPGRRIRHWSNSHRRLVAGVVLSATLFLVGIGVWFATRRPYHIREYHTGVTYQSAGELNLALIAFQKAVAQKPEYLEGRYALAHTHLALGNETQALEQFILLAKEHDHTASMACTGYCFNLLGSHAYAIPWYEKAIEAGAVLASIHNNLAICYEVDQTMNTTPGRIRQAAAHFDKALQLAPTSEIVRYNYAIFELLRVQHNSRYVPIKGLEHIQIAIKEIPNNPGLYFVAAQLYAAVALSDASILDDLMKLLLDACKRDIGIDILQLQNTPCLQSICEHPKFPQLLHAASMQGAESKNTKIQRFIYPMAETLRQD